MDNETLDVLTKVESLLIYPASMEHYCDETGCTIDSPKCTDMHTQAALKRLQDLLEPAHVSLQPNRLGNDAERIFAEYWRHENERKPGINKGYTLLEWIVTPNGGERPERVSQRDAHVAASVIQWLGTRCGYGFMLTCERRIKEARAERAKWSDYVNHNAEPPDDDMEAAKLLAGPFIAYNARAHDELVRGICGALRKAREEAAGEALLPGVA